MHLETKASLLIAVVLLLIGGLHLYIHWGIVYPGFRDIEEQTAAQNLRRCRDALNRELYHLDLLASDWAYWDDTYRFAEDANPEYIEANLTDETFHNTGLCVLYIFNDKQETVYHRLYHIDPSLTGRVHEQMVSLRATLFSGDSVTGIINTPAAPMALASRAILTSSQDGPCRGRLVMARLIDEAMILQISKQTHVPFTLIPFEKAAEDKQPVIRTLSSSDEYFEIRSRQHLNGYAALPDIFGHPAFLLEMKQLRQITQAGKNTVGYSLIPTLSILICMLFICLYFIQHHLIGPINEFSTQLRAIRRTRDFHERVTLPKEPEIRKLATEFNRLMRRLSLYNSKRNEAEAKLREAVRQADYANHSKSAFLASMSHEIRTPMNAILGFSELLSEEALTEQQKGYIEVIHTNGQSLLELINDILDLSKIEAGRLVLEQIACPLIDQLQAVEILMRPTAQKRGLEFGISIAKGCPELLYADPLRLKQCLINLAGNAIKFTTEGHVFINVYMDERSEGEFVCIAVEDTGIGIAHDRQEAIFEAFTQSDYSTSRCFGGTGLGLAITKKLVSMMQGQLLLQSEPGKGSIFTISLPVSRTAPTPLSHQEANA
jgi:signal transduction histidine kinase